MRLSMYVCMYVCVCVYVCMCRVAAVSVLSGDDNYFASCQDKSVGEGCVDG